MALNFDFYGVARELKNMLQRDKDLAAILNHRSKEILINEFANEEPNLAPWCGVYCNSANINPNTLPRGWKAQPLRVTVLLQASNMKSSEACFETLQQMVSAALDVITARNTLNGKVAMLTSIDLSYTYIQSERESLYFQAAIIELEYELTGTART